MSLAKKYRADTKLSGTITHNTDDGRIDVEILSQYHHFTLHAVDLPPTSKDKLKKKDRVTVISNGRGTKYPNAEAAIKEYEEAVRGCDPRSSECGRYNYILMKLREGAKIIDDSFA